MSVISVLDRSVSELIAAGEVIERPSSVIKELVENSIDAGAKHITVEIKNGGTAFMRIVDDGCGMAAEDVPTAFLRHATSKVSRKADLDTILTLGFRGEALASVAAVAKVTILTKRREDALGTKYEIAGMESTPPEECGCPDGTTLIVKDLFFNVPARRKFMKRDVAEGNAVSQIIQKIAISRPEIAFRFIRDNKPEFCSDGSGELLAAVYAVYGKDLARDLIPVDYEENGISVKGYTVKPLYARNSRSFQNFFVNTRYVHSKACSVALESAYENMVMTGKFPVCVLFLGMEPHMLDVNIHPAKAEVRFSDEKLVINAIYFAVRNAMLAAGLIYEFQIPRREWYGSAPQPSYEQAPLVQEVPPEPEKPAPATPAPVVQDSAPAAPPPGLSAPAPAPVQERETLPASAMPFPLPEMPAPAAPAPVSPPEELPPVPVPGSVPRKEDTPFPDVKVVGELFANYILAQSGDTFIIIDKHAAHERVIFERLRKENCQQYRQMLLMPCKVLLTLEECAAMAENTELLERLGFSIDLSEKPYVTATAAPVFFERLELDGIIEEIARNLCLGKVDPQSHQLDDMLHELACKSAIKANDRNDISELQALAEQACSNEDIRHCPHGRPVMFTMSKYELEKQFRRRV